MWGGGRKIEENNKKVLPLKVPLRRPWKSRMRWPLRSLGKNFKTKIFKFRWFLALSDQNELYRVPI